MKITSTSINNGIIDDKHGCRGELNEYGIPTCSIPLKFEDVPENTVSFAIFIEDKDAFPVSGGFSWVHWTVANITANEIFENESISNKDWVQGVNSWISMQGGNVPAEVCSFYGGMYPPKNHGKHTYEINVYALDCKLDLKNGFYLNELFHAMEGHILDTGLIKGVYEN